MIRSTRPTIYDVDTSRTTAARMFYETVYEGYDHRHWDDLPTHQRWRYIRAVNRVCDYLERTLPQWEEAK